MLIEHGRPEPDCLISNLGPTTVSWASDFKLCTSLPLSAEWANKSAKFIGLLTTKTCVTTVHVRRLAQCLA